jgi:DNA-directed RNA polymerase subunit RPC12/RpoP
MGTCKKCRKSSLLLMTSYCEDCKGSFCAECFFRSNGISLCKDCLARRRTQYYSSMTSQWDSKCPLCGAKGTLYMPEMTVHRQFKIVDNSPKYYGPILIDSRLMCNACNNQINSSTLETYRSAVRAEQAGRYEDAANLYEKLDFLDKARSLRERGKTTTVRQVHVNINTLLEQMKAGSLVVPYKCPNCHAAIKISGEMSADRLANCPYCGSTLAIADIEKFLSTIL